jgi:hypothetical protein
MASYLDITRVPVELLIKWLEKDGCCVSRNATGALRITCRCGSRLALLQASDRDVAESTAAHIRARLGCGCVRQRKRILATSR